MVVLYFLRGDFATANAWVPVGLTVLLVFLLVRYLSTRYTIDEEYLRAWRLLGGQKVKLAEVHRIEVSALRDLSPTGFYGAWGWRGRMWSPSIGPFDSIHTEPIGLLVTGGAHPLFISPRDVPSFARELSRRVRSYTGPLEFDAGHPGAG